MKKIYLFFIMVLMLLQNIKSQTTLLPGDICLININSLTPDNFDFIPLVDLEAGTIIHFTDNAWTFGDSLRSNEGIATWTASTPISKGTIVSYLGSAGGNWSTSGSFAISNNGETILIFQGSSSNPNFIGGIGWGKGDNWTYTNTNYDSRIPSSLSFINHTITQLGTDNNYKYNGQKVGSKSQLLALISAPTNWISDDINTFPPTTITFTITPSNFCIQPYLAYVSEKLWSSALLEWKTFGDENSWNIEYGSIGHVFGTGTFVTSNTTSYPLTGLTTNTSYSYYVQANCSSDSSNWVGPIFFKTTCYPTNLPYIENFDNIISPDIPNCTSEYNTNNDNQIWETFSSPGLYRSSPNSLKIKYNQYLAMDDWFFLKGLELEPNKIYRLEFYYRANGMSVLPEKLEVKIGNSPDISSMSNNTLFENQNITYDNFQLAYTNFTIPTNGAYFIGFHGFSDIDMDHLIIDDIKVSEVVNPSSNTSILEFNIPLQISSNIDTNTSTINILMPHGTDKSALIPTILVSNGATISPFSGISQNFSNPFNYFVIAENTTSTRQWTVIVTNDTLSNCGAPTDIIINSEFGENAQLSWTPTGEETLWNIRYKKTSDQVYNYISSVSTNPYTLSNLTLNTSYLCNIQAICNTNNLSNWSSEMTFNTTTKVETVLQNSLNNVYYTNNSLFIENHQNAIINEISIYNLAGQKIYSARPNRTDDIIIPIQLIDANYIVKIITKENVGTYKIFIY